MRRILFALALVACGDPAGPVVGSPATATLDGDPLAGEVAKPITVTVVVKDSTGAPVPGRLVNFIASFGGGSVFAGSALTDTAGKAKEVWTLGQKAGTQNLEVRWVSPTGLPIVLGAFVATAAPGAAVTPASIGGGDRVMIVGSQIGAASVAPLLDAKDTYGNAIASPAPVYTAGLGLTLSGGSATADSVGRLTLRVVSGQLDVTRYLQSVDDVTKGVAISSRCLDGVSDSVVYTYSETPATSTGQTSVSSTATYFGERAEYSTQGRIGTTVASATWTLVQRSDSIIGTVGTSTHGFKRTGVRRYETSEGTVCPATFSTRGIVRLMVKP